MTEEELARLISALQRPAAYPHPAPDIQHLETHISHILLAGDYAYKLKKPLDLGFLDFSTLEQRQQCCEEEVRLNRRLAPDLYLGVVTVNGSLDAPCISGPGPLLEYAVQMRRFPQTALLNRQPLTPDLINRLAELIADFHAAAPPAAPDSGFGAPERVFAPMIENLTQIRARTDQPQVHALLDRLESWTRARFETLMPIIETRRAEGFVRECHGDLHRGNIALVDDRIYVFDAIEFNPNLRWIDTASDIAFFVMDLEQAGEPAAARRFLNRYLERTGDYGALRVLDFYKVYRALVRAKVMAIRLRQTDLGSEVILATRRDLMRYLELALSYTQSRYPRLLIACGLPGSGKSRLSLRLREVWPLIHLRSDIERKRLFGLSEQAHTASRPNGGIYFPQATEWTYDRLYRLADLILAGGYDVLVDATFIVRARRRRFAELARRHGAGFAILALEAPLEVLRERIKRRLAQGSDPSEADLQVLERQYSNCEPLGPEECTCALRIDTSRDPPFVEILDRLSRLLDQTSDLTPPTQAASEPSPSDRRESAA